MTRKNEIALYFAFVAFVVLNMESPTLYGAMTLDSESHYLSLDARIQTPQSIVIDPDSRLQELLDEVVIASVLQDEDEFTKLLIELKDRGGAQYEHLVQQLVIYSARIGDDCDMFQAMLPGLIVEQLGIRDLQLVQALVPYIDSSDNTIKAIVKNYLAGTENLTPSGSPDFSNYVSVLTGQIASGKSMPRKLILYMYKRHPCEGLLTVWRAMGHKVSDWKSILWAEHQVSDVLWKWRYGFLLKDETTQASKTALVPLVTSESWWVRLYVAEIMRKYPPFRDDVIIEQLAEDSDESVRVVIQEILIDMAKKSVGSN